MVQYNQITAQVSVMPITIKLPPKEEARLQRQAARLGISVEEYAGRELTRGRRRSKPMPRKAVNAKSSQLQLALEKAKRYGASWTVPHATGAEAFSAFSEAIADLNCGYGDPNLSASELLEKMRTEKSEKIRRLWNG